MTAAILPLLLCCAHGGSLPTTSLLIGPHKVRVEVADEPGERHNGLMFRKELAPDRGMLFVYPDVDVRAFWMENTSIPLSIAFVDAEGRIVRIRDMRPFDRSRVLSGAPALYAIEMNQGWFAAHEVDEGTMVQGLPGPAER